MKTRPTFFPIPSYYGKSTDLSKPKEERKFDFKFAQTPFSNPIFDFLYNQNNDKEEEKEEDSKNLYSPISGNNFDQSTLKATLGQISKSQGEIYKIKSQIDQSPLGSIVKPHTINSPNNANNPNFIKSNNDVWQGLQNPIHNSQDLKQNKPQQLQNEAETYQNVPENFVNAQNFPNSPQHFQNVPQNQLPSSGESNLLKPTYYSLVKENAELKPEDKIPGQYIKRKITHHQTFIIPTFHSPQAMATMLSGTSPNQMQNPIYSDEVYGSSSNFKEQIVNTADFSVQGIGKKNKTENIKNNLERQTIDNIKNIVGSHGYPSYGPYGQYSYYGHYPVYPPYYPNRQIPYNYGNRNFYDVNAGYNDKYSPNEKNHKKDGQIERQDLYQNTFRYDPSISHVVNGRQISLPMPFQDFFPIIIKNPFQMIANAFTSMIEYGPQADVCAGKENTNRGHSNRNQHLKSSGNGEKNGELKEQATKVLTDGLSIQVEIDKANKDKMENLKKDLKNGTENVVGTDRINENNKRIISKDNNAKSNVVKISFLKEVIPDDNGSKDFESKKIAEREVETREAGTTEKLIAKDIVAKETDIKDIKAKEENYEIDEAPTASEKDVHTVESTENIHKNVTRIDISERKPPTKRIITIDKVPKEVVEKETKANRSAIKEVAKHETTLKNNVEKETQAETVSKEINKTQTLTKPQIKININPKITRSSRNTRMLQDFNRPSSSFFNYNSTPYRTSTTIEQTGLNIQADNIDISNVDIASDLKSGPAIKVDEITVGGNFRQGRKELTKQKPMELKKLPKFPFGNKNEKEEKEEENKRIVSLDNNTHQVDRINSGSGIFVNKIKVQKGGVAIAGPGGIATAGSGGTAIVGPNGYAYTHPGSLAVAGTGSKVIAVDPSMNLQEVANNAHNGGNGGEMPTARFGKIVAVGPVIYYNKG